MTASPQGRKVLCNTANGYVLQCCCGDSPTLTLAFGNFVGTYARKAFDEFVQFIHRINPHEVRFQLPHGKTIIISPGTDCCHLAFSAEEMEELQELLRKAALELEIRDILQADTST